MIAGQPTDTVVPDAVLALAHGRTVRAVWRNALGGLTFEIGQAAERVFVKWAPTDSGLNLGSEIARLQWAMAYTCVPRVLGNGGDDMGTWFTSEPLAGENALSARWRGDPAVVVRAIGEGLRALHDALPVDLCPFSWSLEERVADVERRAYANALAPERWHADHRHLSIAQALE